MLINHGLQQRNSRKYRAVLQRRMVELVKYPPGTEISYKASTDSLGVVVGHDKIIGRLNTNLGGSHDPLEIKEFKIKTRE